MPREVIYLDHNASTRVHPSVLEAMLPWFRENWANPSSTVHQLGRAAHAAVDNARNEVAALLGCEPDEVIFTSGASEANALAIGGARPASRPPDCIVTADIEHRSVISSCLLAQDRGIPLEILRVGADGFISSKAIAKLPLTDRSVVSLQWVNNETGAINPVAAIAAAVKARGALLHIDAAQAAGKIDIDLQQLPVDLLTISAHKFYGPKGIGALFVRRGTPLEPLIRGGHQEGGRRAGTENVPAVVGFGETCRLAREEAAIADRARIAGLRDELERRLAAALPDTLFLRSRGERVGNTTVCAWEGLSNREILRALDRASICAGSGSACTSESNGPSHVLRSMGITPSVAGSAVRFGFGRDNAADELPYIVDAIIAAVSHLREMMQIERPH